MRFERAYRSSRALGAAWQAASSAPASLLGGGALLVLCDLALAAWAWLVLRGCAMPDAQLAALLACCATCATAPLALALRALLLFGHARAVERVATRGEERLADLLDLAPLRGRLPAVLLAGTAALLWRLALLAPAALLVLVGPRPAALALAALPLLWLFAWAALLPYAVAYEGLGARAALARARALAAGHRLRLLVHEALLLAAAALGLGLCGLGVLAAGALAEVARCEGYLRLVRRAPWWLDGGA